MAAIPHSMMMAKTISKKKKKNKQLPSDQPVYYTDTQLSKYNKKMMDSIWGMYNKYSVHNFKSVQGDLLTSFKGLAISNENLQSIPNAPAQYDGNDNNSGEKRNIGNYDGFGKAVTNMFNIMMNYESQ